MPRHVGRASARAWRRRGTRAWRTPTSCDLNTVRFQVYATCLSGPTVAKAGAAVTKPKLRAPKLERIE